MTKSEIVEQLARERFVEQMVGVITRQREGADRSDLAQMVYEALLAKPEETITKAQREGWIKHLAVAIIERQALLDSPFNRLYKGYQRRYRPLPEGLDLPDPDGHER